LVNNAASDFCIPAQYNARNLLHKNTLKGFNAASDYNPQTSHFLALCMKVVYEKELIIKVRQSAANGSIPLLLLLSCAGSTLTSLLASSVKLECKHMKLIGK
jgi:hypothetical protein